MSVAVEIDESVNESVNESVDKFVDELAVVAVDELVVVAVDVALAWQWPKPQDVAVAPTGAVAHTVAVI